VPDVFFREALPREDMPEMSPALGADDLRKRRMPIGLTLHGAGDFVVEGGPAASGVEFMLRPIQGCIATLAEIGPRFLVLLVLAGERALRSLVQDHALLFGG